MASACHISATASPNCAICLVDYELGDEICYSHNPRCHHYFHRECIMEWLKHHDECPCCRCNYLALDDEDNEVVDRDEDDSSDNGNNRPSLEDFHYYNDQLARLYQTGPYAPSTEPSTSELPLHYQQQRPSRSNEEWEDRWQQTIERVRNQLRTQLERFQQQEEDQQQPPRRGRRRAPASQEPNRAGSDDRLERSLEFVRGQMRRLQQGRRPEEQRQASTSQSNSPGNGVPAMSSTSNSNSNNAEASDYDSLDRAMEMVRIRIARLQEHLNSNNNLNNRTVEAEADSSSNRRAGPLPSLAEQRERLRNILSATSSPTTQGTTETSR